ncbi:TPA: hypothetical protein ACJI8Q_001779 [Morganella morganii]
MQELLKIFGSPPFVAIAWLCTVASCIYAFFQKANVTKIKQKFDNLEITYNDLKIQNSTLQQNYESLQFTNNELKIKNNNLEQKIITIEKSDIQDNSQEVHQHGQNNFNQGVIKGDFVYKK